MKNLTLAKILVCGFAFNSFANASYAASPTIPASFVGYPPGEERGWIYLGLSRWIAMSSHRFSTPKSEKAMTPSSLGPWTQIRPSSGSMPLAMSQSQSSFSPSSWATRAMGWKYALADPNARKSSNRNKPSRPRLQHEAGDQAARRRTTATGHPGLTTKGRFNPRRPKPAGRTSVKQAFLHSLDP